MNTKEKLLTLFRLCCEKRPHELIINSRDKSSLPEYTAEIKAGELMDASRHLFNKQMESILDELVSIMPKGNYGDVQCEYPFSHGGGDYYTKFV